MFFAGEFVEMEPYVLVGSLPQERISLVYIDMVVEPAVA